MQSQFFAAPLMVTLSIATALRLFVALAFPNSWSTDEVFQYIEQAHRLVFGQGYVPWEFQIGLRSWLIPLLLAGPMALAHGFTPAPAAELLLIRILLCAASLPMVWCAGRWGGRFYGAKGVWIAGLLAALWPDLWLMAPHPLEESLSADILVPAIYLVEACRLQRNLQHVALAGFLLGLCFALREQLAPAIAIAGIFLCGRNPRRWLLALPMAAIPVLCTGLLDWFTWGQMFRSFWLNFYLNVVLGVASQDFTSSPPAYFLLNLFYDWLWAALLIGYFAWLGARKLPVAGLASASILIVHSCLAHKELRFIFPAMALLVPLAGVGLAGIWEERTRLQKRLLAAGLLTGPYLSPLFYMMLPWQDNAFELYSQLATREPCLVSIQTWDRGFWPILPVFGGRTRFTGAPAVPDAANVIEPDAIVAAETTPDIPPGFTRQGCKPESWVPFKPRQPEVCYWTRPVAACRTGPIAPFVLVYPAQARAFIIRDRLTDAP
jgi:phosphatidylinositol glycan class B